MQRLTLVNYDSSSSADSSQSAYAGKERLHHEESEVSSSVEQDEANGLTAESIPDEPNGLTTESSQDRAAMLLVQDEPNMLTAELTQDCSAILLVQDEQNLLTMESTQDRAAILLELGCTREQIAHAFNLWGPATAVEDLFDFIQASKFLEGEENTLSRNPACQEGTQMDSREACKLSGEVGNSWETKSNVVEEPPRYVHTSCHTKEASCSRRQHAGHFGQNEEEIASPLQNLESLGFSKDFVLRASEKCNSIDFDVLLEHLVETTNEGIRLRNQSRPEAGSLGNDCQKGNRSAAPFERLLMMGYTSTTIQKASDECNSIDFDVLLKYLIEAEDKGLQNREHPEKDFSEDDNGKVTPLKNLQKMGFSDFSIEKAIKTSGCQGFEGIRNVFSTSACMNIKKDMDGGWAERQRLGDIPNLQENATCASPLKRKNNAGETVGTTQCQWGEILWTGSMEKQWYSYVGCKEKLDYSLLSESEGSGSDDLGVTPKPKRGKKKLEFPPHKQVLNVRKMEGKMMGFGIPGFFIGRPNPVPHLMQGPPYFYYENVASVPNNEWGTIKRHFNGVDPEFVDAKFFSAARRPRGYVHNLPIENRMQLQRMPPMTIFEAFPDTKKYWPSWDTREKLNCIGTRKAPDTLCGLIRRIFQKSEGVDIPYSRQQEIIKVCKKWNLVWVGPGQTAPLDPVEMELLLGFDQNHTRGCSSTTERYEALGNSFQVSTVAYHLSPLKFLYPDGITVLSLFSGIGGAEVALDTLGVHLKLVIAVEINEKLRGVLASWWKKSGQTGQLKLRENVRDLTNDNLNDLIDEVGRIDLIIGGSPCNNLSGNNRVSRVGLCGNDSSLFFEFTRILNFVRQAMHERGFV